MFFFFSGETMFDLTLLLWSFGVADTPRGMQEIIDYMELEMNDIRSILNDAAATSSTVLNVRNIGAGLT